MLGISIIKIIQAKLTNYRVSFYLKIVCVGSVEYLDKRGEILVQKRNDLFKHELTTPKHIAEQKYYPTDRAMIAFVDKFYLGATICPFP